MTKNKNTIPSIARTRAALMTLAMSQSTRDILDKLDIEEARSVETIGRLLHAGAVDSNHMTRLIAKLEEAGAKPSRGVLEELSTAMLNSPEGRAALALASN